MVSQRNKLLDLIQYLKSFGVEVNIGKNKARGNKGLFKVCNQKFRIDVAKKLDEDSVLKTLIHEFAHFIHYHNDNRLQSLEFIFEKEDEFLTEELIQLTVNSIPKESVAPIFDAKESIKNEIKTLTKNLSVAYPDFKASEPFNKIEQKIKKTNLKYLLKHDRVKLIEGFSTKLYSIDSVQQGEIKDYLKLKSLQRNLRRVNSRINRLNKYYNSPTELFARAMEMYFTDIETFSKKAPNLFKHFEQTQNSMIIGLKEILL